MSPHRSARLVVWLGTGFHAGIVLVALLAHGGDPSYFVRFGRNDRTRVAEQAIGGPVLVQTEHGHDGQQFWIQAHDPWVRDPRFLSTYLDRPAYRAQRMLYPLLTSAFLALGERALLFGMVLINLAAVVAGTLAVRALARGQQMPVRVALAFAANPAVVLSTLLDLADGLALAAIAAAAAGALSRRFGLAVTAAVAAALTREWSLAAIVGLAVLTNRLSTRQRAALAILPAAAVLAWGLYVRARFGWPSTPIIELGVPLVGWTRALVFSLEQRDALNVLALLLSAGAVVLVGWRWWQSRSPVLAAAVPYLALVPSLTRPVLDLPGNVFRAFGPVFLFLAIDALGSTSPGEGPILSPRREALGPERCFPCAKSK